MKNLVLGALILATSATGCVVNNTNNPPPVSYPAVVTANWSIDHFSPMGPRSCPIGYDTASIVSQPWDPINNVTFGTPIVDKFNCSDMHGVTDTLDGIYLVWVQIEDHNGANVYAKSGHVVFDTAGGNLTIPFHVWDDAGQFFLTWDIVRAGSGAALSCADVGAGAKVGTSATLATDTTVLFADNFKCTDYYGTTDPLVAGTYTVTVQALLSNGQALGGGITLTSKQLTSPNGLTDLGHVLIPIP
jgi:hypothetical protein